MAGPRRLPTLLLLINGGAAIAACLLFALLLPWVGGTGEAVPLPERLAHALRLSVWPAALILAMVAATALTRFRTRAFDPIAAPEGRIYRIQQRVLTNTVEQTSIFLPCFFALAVMLPDRHLGALDLALGFFLAGRLAFWAGYAIHPLARAPGMAVTLAVNGGLVLYLGWRSLG